MKAVDYYGLAYFETLGLDRGHLDGSFGFRDEFNQVGGVWFNAHMLKTLQQAKSLVIFRDKVSDESIRAKAASFIGRHARPDGSIEEVGTLHNVSLASSSPQNITKSVYLTAYSLVALLQKPIASASHSTQHEEVIQRGLNYLESQLNRNSGDLSLSSALTPRELAMIAYTMSLAGSERQIAADRAYKLLWDLANKLDDHIWWSSGKVYFNNDKRPASGPKAKYELLDRADHMLDRNGSDIEISSWALLATTRRREIERALPIARWLTSQQRSDGGFGSAQDTVIAMEALTAFVEANLPLSFDVELDYPNSSASTVDKKGSLPTNRINLDRVHVSNSDASIQLTQLPDNITWVQIKATSAGNAVVQVSWQYNLLAQD